MIKQALPKYFVQDCIFWLTRDVGTIPQITIVHAGCFYSVRFQYYDTSNEQL